MNKKTLLKISLLMVVVLQLACTQKEPTDLAQAPFIPLPVSITATGNSFTMSDATAISAPAELKGVAEYLAGQIEKVAGFEPKIADNGNSEIVLQLLAEDPELGQEGYVLKIDEKMVTVSASKTAGIFNGIQTLLQTMTTETNASQALEIATGEIRDYPNYAYRGAMLDVARHFFTVEEVKQFIDYLALYKMNALHLHLSDDQGWRIEIKSWPKLTEIGGSTEVGGGPGGFYTQEEYKDLVDYAQVRNIVIVPEIDMPGHTNAALASYPELNCNGKATELYTGTEVGFSTLCTDKEITYEFIDDVIREISAITPGPYFHIGGDESHSTPLEDYIPFVERVMEIALKYNKKVIGWDEIANAKLVEDATVQFWANVENTNMGLEQNARVLVSPATKAYLDMQYDSTSTFGLHWAAFIEVDDAYRWDPLEQVPGIAKDQILGIEAPLWAETISNIDEAEYLLFPRLPGYAEIGWTQPSQRNWDEYKLRLAQHGKHFDEMGIDFFRSNRVPW